MTITVQDAVAAIVNGPDLEDVRIYDENFHVKQASISRYDDAVDIDGSISRIANYSSDYQIYYSISIRSATIDKIEKKIKEGGVEQIAPILEDVAAKIAQLKKVPITKDEIHGFLSDLNVAVYGGDAWQFITDRIIAGVALFVLRDALEGFPPKSAYLITVKTGSDEDAGTDANVYIRLVGDKPNPSGQATEVMRFLASKFKMLDDFESGRYAQTFRVLVEDIGELQGIKIGHDNSGNKPGWLLETVTVEKEEIGQAGKRWTFLWNNWLSADAAPEATSAGIETPVLLAVKASIPYTVIVKTGSKDSAGTDANVWIEIRNSDTNTHTGRYALAEAGRNNFEKGQTDSFTISGEDIGNITHIVLGHDGMGEKPGWFVEAITVKRDDLGAEWRFDTNRWLANGELGSVADGTGRKTEPIPGIRVR